MCISRCSVLKHLIRLASHWVMSEYHILIMTLQTRRATYTSPEEFGRMVVPCGTTTVIADPHEIVNVYGLEGFNYMIRAAERTELSVRYMIPSCVPATPFEDSGAIVNAFDMQWPMGDRHVPGLGEFMNFPGVLSKREDDINKLIVAQNMGKVIDGHSPKLSGPELNAYIAAGVMTDHECTTVAEMRDRLRRGMYVLMRDGSACHDLENLIPALDDYNYRRCLLCSDDRQPKTIFENGHINSHLKKLVAAGIDPVQRRLHGEPERRRVLSADRPRRHRAGQTCGHRSLRQPDRL